jgi:hypothetical protein
MAAKKTVPVTSVTPRARVTATSKAQQARTRNLVMGIASVTPVGRVARGAVTVAKGAKTARAANVAQKMAYKEKVTIPAKRVVKEAKAEIKANARGLKAANKPTNKVGSKADKELRSRTKSVVLSKEETKANYDYYYGKGSGEGITQINKRVTPKNEASSVRKSPVKLTKKSK